MNYTNHEKSKLYCALSVQTR